MNDWAVLAVIYAAVFIASPLIAIFHELGHALAYIILTKPEKVDIYIGSYGIKKNALQFRTGKIHFFIKRSFPFIKGIGLCSSSKLEPDYRKYIIILLAGPVFTLFAAAVITLVVVSINAHLLAQIFCYIFLGFSFLSLIGNLAPRQIDASQSFGLQSDGAQLLFTLKLKRLLPDYHEALSFYKEKKYSHARTRLENVLAAVPGEAKVLRLLANASLMEKDYATAALYLTILEKKNEPSLNDLMTKAYLQVVTDRHAEAIAIYQKVLKKDRNNIIALNNMAGELIEEGAYLVAQQVLDKALKLNNAFDYGYNTLAYLNIVQGRMAMAKTAIDKSMVLNSQNADTYKTLGVYYLRLNDAGNARANFNKAIELDKSIDLGKFEDELQGLIKKSVTA